MLAREDQILYLQQLHQQVAVADLLVLLQILILDQVDQALLAEQVIHHL
tara:strand:- start:397 stop:543 length:147 start_codon:yes stop_codon:yes gene_type:complete